MAYIQNTHLAEKKQVFIALQKIYGIGCTKSKQICDQLGISCTITMEHLTPSQVEQLKGYLTRKVLTGHVVQRGIRLNLQRLTAIGCYRGRRYMQGLPSRGQRTHGNSRTVRRLRGR